MLFMQKYRDCHKIIISSGASSALDNREYLVIIRDNFCSFFRKSICCEETVQMSGHNIIMVLTRNKKKLSSDTPFYLELLLKKVYFDFDSAKKFFSFI